MNLEVSSVNHPERLEIEGGAIYLRLINENDPDELYTIIDENRTFLQDTQPWVRDATPESVQAAVQVNLQKLAQGIWLQYRIIDGATDHMIGVVTLHDHEPGSTEAQLGCWLIEAEQDKGYGFLTITRLLQYAFPGWGLERVSAKISPGDLRSESLARKMGATVTGRLVESKYRKGVMLREWVLTK